MESRFIKSIGINFSFLSFGFDRIQPNKRKRSFVDAWIKWIHWRSCLPASNYYFYSST